MDIIIKNMCDNYNDNFDIKKELQEVTPLGLVKSVPELITEIRAEKQKVIVLREAIVKVVSMFIGTEIDVDGNGFVDNFNQGACGLLEEALGQDGK